MPESRGRRKTRPTARRRNKTAEARARATQAAQREAEDEKRKMSPAAYRRRRFIGWSLVALGVAVGVEHFLEHIGLLNLFPVLGEVGLGWPMAGLLGVAGAIILSK